MRKSPRAEYGYVGQVCVTGERERSVREIRESRTSLDASVRGICYSEIETPVVHRIV